MEALQTVQQALVYLEDHLLRDVTLSELADYIDISPFHLNQTFTMICGMNIEEYIHRRRMSEAAQALISGNYTLLDIARQYGYSNANDFSRDFSDMHGLSPIQVRSNKDKVMKFDRLYVKFGVTETPPIIYHIQQLPEKRLVGFRVHIPADELINHFITADVLFEAAESGQLVELQQLNASAPLTVVTHPVIDGLEVFYGIPYESSTTLETEYIHHSKFAVFNHQGHIDYLFNEIWQSIEQHTAITLDYLRNDYYIAQLSLPLNFDSHYTKAVFMLPIK